MGFLELRRPWGFSPEARRGSQGASRAAPGKSGLHARGEGERVMALESREGTRASRRVEEAEAWPTGGPIAAPLSQTGSQHPLSHSLAPQDMLSLLFLPPPTQRLGRAPHHLQTGHALQGGIRAGSTKCSRQVTLWGVNLPPTPDPGTEFIRVQRSQSLGGHLCSPRDEA